MWHSFIKKLRNDIATCDSDAKKEHKAVVSIAIFSAIVTHEATILFLTLVIPHI